MTTEHEASRTLVKSPPELWAECSDPGSLARHLGEFGEITITRLEPESAVAWEGEHASGTVRIEPSGWGTRVTLTAHTNRQVAEAQEAEPEVEDSAAAAGTFGQAVDPKSDSAEEADDATLEETLEEPDPVPVADTGRGRARWRRLTARFRRAFAVPEPSDEPDAEAEPEAPVSEPPEAVAAADPPLEAEPEPESEREPEREPTEPTEPAAPSFDAAAILASALDSLGQAHHRPFSRA
jgi:hypothetical protein